MFQFIVNSLTLGSVIAITSSITVVIKLSFSQIVLSPKSIIKIVFFITNITGLNYGSGLMGLSTG
jgi:hypothetical protein